MRGTRDKYVGMPDAPAFFRIIISGTRNGVRGLHEILFELLHFSHVSVCLLTVSKEFPKFCIRDE